MSSPENKSSRRRDDDNNKPCELSEWDPSVYRNGQFREPVYDEIGKYTSDVYSITKYTQSDPSGNQQEGQTWWCCLPNAAELGDGRA